MIRVTEVPRKKDPWVVVPYETHGQSCTRKCPFYESDGRGYKIGWIGSLSCANHCNFSGGRLREAQSILCMHPEAETLL